MARQRVAAIVAIVIGAGLGIAPFAFGMFSRAPGGGEMITDFEPYMDEPTITEFRGYLLTIDRAVADITAIEDEMVATGAIDRDGLATAYPSVETLRSGWPAVDEDMTDLLDRMDRNLDNYAAVASLPPFALFPWFFLVPGAMSVVAGAVALAAHRAPTRRERRSRIAIAAIAVIGVGLVLAPVGFQMFTRAPLGGEMIDDFTPMMTVERVRDVQAHFITLGGGESQLRAALVPAAVAAGVDLEAYPAATEFSATWPAMLQDFNPMIATMRDNVDRFDGVAAMPPFGWFPWFFLVPGLLVTVTAIAALRGTGSRSSTPGGSRP